MDVSFSDLDLPWSAKCLLKVIDSCGGSVTRSTLLERADMPVSTLDRALAQLEADGVVRRNRDPTDLRFVRVEIVEPSEWQTGE